jgi:hypothetical protein
MLEDQRNECLRVGIVPHDYPHPVANDWPDLVEIVERRVKGRRAAHSTAPWWQFERRRAELYAAIKPLKRMLVTARVSPLLSFAFLSKGVVYNEKTIVLPFEKASAFSVLQSRLLETWVRTFTSTLKDDLNYAPSDCFRTFPFPEGFESDATLEAAGEVYHAFRAQVMIDRNEGLTKTYNRFHARVENTPEVARLRELHAEMDAAALRAYGWDDLADRAAPEFIEQGADEGKKPKARLD